MSSIYKQAADVLSGLLKREGGLKTLAFAKGVKQNKSVYALVSQTLKYRPILEELFLTCRVPAKTRTRALLHIMAYDLLFGSRQKIQGGGKLKQVLAAKEATLRTALSRLMVRRKVADTKLLIPEALRGNLGKVNPRYVRVNSLKLAVGDAVRRLAADGFPDAVRDPDVPGLLRLPAGTDLHAHELVTTGALILQDKASCFPAEVLLGPCARSAEDGGGGDGPEWMTGAEPFDVIDACAAPGNKTSHLAMLLKSSRHHGGDGSAILAFDKSKPRLALLDRRMRQAGADNVRLLIVQVSLQDFLATDPTDPKYARVKAMLLDPSCSGSGMASRLDHRISGKAAAPTPGADAAAAAAAGGTSGSAPEDVAVRPSADEAARVAKLASFQVKCLAHALKFPALRRFTYSTCSVYEEENEVVVSEVLRLCREQAATQEAATQQAAAATGGRSDSGTGDSGSGTGDSNGDTASGGAGGGKAQVAAAPNPFRLESALPSWHRRGYPGPRSGVAGTPGVHPGNTLTAAEARCLCRVMPGPDKMNGFFLACFSRDPPPACAAAHAAALGGSSGSSGKSKKKKKPNSNTKKKKRPSAARRQALQRQAAAAVAAVAAAAKVTAGTAEGVATTDAAAAGGSGGGGGGGGAAAEAAPAARKRKRPSSKQRAALLKKKLRQQRAGAGEGEGGGQAGGDD